MENSTHNTTDENRSAEEQAEVPAYYRLLSRLVIILTCTAFVQVVVLIVLYAKKLAQ